MGRFHGRTSQLRSLDDLLRRVADAPDRPGQALLVRGRRRVGKSRLIEEWIARAGIPALYFTASTRSTQEELGLFVAEASASDLPGARNFEGVTLSGWEAALRQVAAALPEGPAVVVIDEMPYLVAGDPAFEGTLQKVWDRELSRRRVLLVLVGSDLAMMEALNDYGRPFHQRAAEMVVPPLSPTEVGAILGLEPADAVDAYLVSGGLPLILDEWPARTPVKRYLRAAVTSPTSALLVSAERSLAAEFPVQAQARDVLQAVGAGERTFANIARAAGDLQATSLNRSLKVLQEKRVVTADIPLSTRPSKETRYRVADPYLRFWLAFLGPHLAEIERGRGDRVLNRIEAGWTSWRGRAVEPMVRESLERLQVLVPRDVSGVVGGYWTRTNDVEVDLVVADRAPVARQVLAVGSVKWLENSPFDERDLARLLVHRDRIPGADEATPVFAVARNGTEVPGLKCYSPEDLLAPW